MEKRQDFRILAPMIENPLFLFSFFFLLIYFSEWLCKKTFLRHVSGALLVIILGAIAANLGVIPSASNPSPIYDAIFQYVAPASIFFLLLGVDLRNLRSAGLPMLLSFTVGSIATFIAVYLSLNLFDYESLFGDRYSVIAGMMTGTYTGGSANFNAVALEYNFLKEGALYTSLVVADNIVTAVWMVITLGIPAFFNRYRKNPEIITNSSNKEMSHEESIPIQPIDLGILLFLGTFFLWFSDYLADTLSSIGLAIPSILLLTTFALVLAQFRFIQKMPGYRLLGLFSVYLFLAVVGAFCEVTALIEIDGNAVTIFLFVSLIVLIHGVALVAFGWFYRMDWSIIAIATQANIGGAGSALALAKSFNRNDLLLPAILAGSLGTALGTYLGFIMVGIL